MKHFPPINPCTTVEPNIKSKAFCHPNKSQDHPSLLPENAQTPEAQKNAQNKVTGLHDKIDGWKNEAKKTTVCGSDYNG